MRATPSNLAMHLSSAEAVDAAAEYVLCYLLATTIND